MNVIKYTVGPFAENTYLITEGEQALIIDPGFLEDSEYQKLKNTIDDRDLDLFAVVLTHAHVDHVLGLQRVVDDFDLPVYLSEKDRYLWNNFGSQAAMFGFSSDGFSFDPDILPITDEWNIGNFSFDVRYTPGHAPDHVSLYSKSDGIVIAGDALFREGIGRTDLYKGDFKVLERSIREQLYSLPDGTVVYPGHGEKTTIGHEKKANPFVTG
ncbi:MBL fold metallo-hydrolase [Fodinibius sp.]|uniref:MBL fold metallo-hydrolase n=1 Tax=Fodinibius sp. TaxID=1872440 RepID=UPI002ACE5236|nr:MBL fold metallo-hydrolase [Fodinibius sp.]MDZ7660096.1 MBL fold metallo-hydrolase [Fodinibius sp.]